MTDNMYDIYILILLLFMSTYVWRFWGVILSRKIVEGGEVGRYCRFLTISVISAMVWKMVLFPTGLLVQTPMAYRVFILLSAVFLYYISYRSMIASLTLSTAIFYMVLATDLF